MIALFFLFNFGFIALGVIFLYDLFDKNIKNLDIVSNMLEDVAMIFISVFHLILNCRHDIEVNFFFNRLRQNMKIAHNILLGHIKIDDIFIFDIFISQKFDFIVILGNNFIQQTNLFLFLFVQFQQLRNCLLLIFYLPFQGLLYT
jgi:hypothetical protein